MKRLIISIAALTAAAASADIPQLADTQCVFVKANGKRGKTHRCTVQSVTSAPRPNLPDTQSRDFAIGKRTYQFAADYDETAQAWQWQYQNKPLAVYHRDRSFRKTAHTDGARYTCYQARKIHFCTPER